MKGAIKGFQTKSVTYHRNGIGGTGFYCVVFTCRDAPGDWICTRFPGEGNYAVINLANLEQPWRGDHFVADVDEAIAAYEQERDRSFTALTKATT